jgi:hypothetical protein
VISLDFSSVASCANTSRFSAAHARDLLQGLLASLLIMGASTCLAIDGDHPFDAGADGLHPLQKTGFKLFRINEGKDSSKGVMGGNAVGQIEQLGEPVLLCFAKFFNPYPSVGSRYSPTNR